MDLLEGSLRGLGAFYVFAGIVAARATLSSAAIDQMIDAIRQTSDNTNDNEVGSASRTADNPARARSAWLLIGAFAVLMSGVTLLLLLRASQWAFLLAALLQAAYLYYLAPVHLDTRDPPDATGRRQTTNAFVLFAAVTAYVMWAGWLGRLLPVEAIDGRILAGTSALTLGFIGHTLWRFTRTLPPR